MNRSVFLIGFFTLLIFGVGGLILIEFTQAEGTVAVLLRGWPIIWQLLIGTLAGLLAAGVALFIITRPFFHSRRVEYYGLIASRLQLNLPVIVYISLCAGVGEELFFRAGLQPLLGLWLTAVIFVALHGYLQFSDWGSAAYGFSMLLIIGGFGYLFRHSGIYSAIMAHSMFDFVILLHIAYSTQKAGKMAGQSKEKAVVSAES